MTKKMYVFTGVAIAVILIVVFGFDQLKSRLIAEKLAAYSPPPIAVTTIAATQTTWTRRITAVGEITADQAVDVTPLLAGQIMSVHFHSGDTVALGDLLVQLDDSLEQDELESDLAKIKLAKLDVDRYTTLVKSNSASQLSLDRAVVMLQTNKASLDATRNKIDYMSIKAPFAGRVGIRQVNIGQYLQPGTPIVNLQDVSILYVDFSLPESDLPDLVEDLEVDIRVDAYPDTVFKATIKAISPQVDPNSRNVDIRARITSDDQRLVPGMYVELSVVTANRLSVFPLPNIAIAYSLYGDTVFVVGKPSEAAGSGQNDTALTYTVERRAVKIGTRRDSLTGVLSGLKPGDQVITSNQQQLNNASIVVINNSVKLDPSAVQGQ